jgi:hypothetical protein
MKRRTDQKFQTYDLIRCQPLIPWIKGPGKQVIYHDYSGKRGVVVGSYADQFGGGRADKRIRKIYTVCFEGLGQVAWIDEDTMTFIEEGRADLYERWR